MTTTPHPVLSTIGNLLILIATLTAFSGLVALTVDTYKAEVKIQKLVESR